VLLFINRNKHKGPFERREKKKKIPDVDPLHRIVSTSTQLYFNHLITRIIERLKIQNYFELTIYKPVFSL
jgi:hypothetical protein